MAGAQKMVELLQALNSSDNAKRHQAETLFQQAKASEPDNLLLGFVAVLGEDQVDAATRTQSAVLTRQMVSCVKSDKDFVFSRLNPTNKQSVAAHLLSRFEAIADGKLQQKVGDVIAKLAETVTSDDPRGWLAPGQKGWPNLLLTVFRLSDPTDASNSPVTCESAIRLLKDLIGPFKDDIIAAQQQLGAVVQGALAHANPKIRCASFVFVCELVGILEKKNWAPLMVTANILTQVLQQLAEANLQDDLQECLQQYLEVASLEPDFFKQQLATSMEPATLLAKFVKTRTGVEEGVRNLSLEWLVTYVEKKPKYLAKSLKNFAPLVLDCCMELMLEVEDGQEELKEWIERMDDEEGEEDADELYHNGEEAIDRVVQAMTMETVGPTLFGLVGKYAAQDAWQAKLAALTAVKQTVEYVEEAEHMNEMAKLLIMCMDHPHPRVRYTSCHALGQLANDQAPQFQDAWHSTVMPILLRMFDDQIDRVASMAMSAFVSFGEELENALMNEYARGFMEKLVGRLQSSKHRMVQEECVTSIAVIAGVIEKDFSQYYDGIMPLLKQLVFSATGEKENRLRGKAFECMSLLGLAVGKEKFLPDAQQAVEEMLKTSTSTAADDLQKEYLKEAFERICKCLKNDFAPFLPHLLPGIFTSLKLEAEDAGAAAAKPAADEEEDEYITVSTGDGKLVKVRSSKFEEMLQAAQLLNTYCEEMEGAFFDYIKPTAEALMPLLSASDEVSLLCDEARSAAFATWAALIKCARAGAKERGQPQTIAGELLRTFLQQSLQIMQKEDDADTLRDTADGLAECLKNCEPGTMAQAEVMQLVEQLFIFIDASFARTVELEKEKKEGAVGAPQELQGDEDDEDNTLDDEDNCRRSLEDAIGSVMKAAPQQFLQCLPACGNKIQQWLSTKEHRALALHMACDMLEHLKDLSEPAWPVFMEQALVLLGDKDAEVRIPAAYAINLAAPIPNFSAAAPQAFQRLAALVSAPAPKKRDDTGKVAMDNCVAALLALMQHKSQCCPPEVPAWQLIVAKLPIKDDEDEAKKVHKTIAEMVLAQNTGLLGPDNAHIGKILSALAEAYKQESLSTKEVDTLILNIFKMLPRENLLKLAGGFSEKQQKKIEKMLTE